MELFFHQDNVPMHKTLDFTNETRDAGFELMAHPPYSPHIDPGDFYLFLKMKNIIQGQKLDRERERENMPLSIYSSVIMNLNFTKKGIFCYKVRGDGTITTIENQQHLEIIFTFEHVTARHYRNQ